MELGGKLWKSGKFWLIAVPSVEVMTQGYSREEALKMIGDAIEGLLDCYFPEEGKDFHACFHWINEQFLGDLSSSRAKNFPCGFLFPTSPFHFPLYS